MEDWSMMRRLRVLERLAWASVTLVLLLFSLITFSRAQALADAARRSERAEREATAPLARDLRPAPEAEPAVPESTPPGGAARSGPAGDDQAAVRQRLGADLQNRGDLIPYRGV